MVEGPFGDQKVFKREDGKEDIQHSFGEMDCEPDDESEDVVYLKHIGAISLGKPKRRVVPVDDEEEEYNAWEDLGYKR